MKALFLRFYKDDFTEEQLIDKGIVEGWIPQNLSIHHSKLLLPFV